MLMNKCNTQGAKALYRISILLPASDSEENSLAGENMTYAGFEKYYLEV